MARFAFKASLSDTWLPDLFDPGTLALQTVTPTQAVWEDTNGASITFTGRGLVNDGGVVTGTLTGATFRDSSSNVLLVVTGMAIPANKIFGWLADGGNLFEALSALGAGNDIITGSSGNDDLMPGFNDGNDTISGLAGFDFIKGSRGDNIMDGGADYDTLSYSETYYDHEAFKGITLNATLGTVANSWGGTDTIRNIEDFRGSKFRDSFLGSSRSEQFSGLSGSDLIDGGGGIDDAAYYERDEQHGGTGGITVDLAINTSGPNAGWGTIIDGFGRTDKVRNIEHVYGTEFADSFTGDARNNRFRGYDGVDSYDGAGGRDTLLFIGGRYDADNGVNVNLSLGANQIIDDGFGNIETATNMEFVVGTDFDDTVTLGASRGGAYGEGGDDTLNAGAAASELHGGDGDDDLLAGSGLVSQSFTGDAGADHFIFDETTLTEGETALHVIQDFSQGDGDIIELLGFGAVFLSTKDQAFSGGNDAVVEVRFVTAGANTRVEIDEDADGTADYMLLVKGSINFTSGDFLLT